MESTTPGMTDARAAAIARSASTDGRTWSRLAGPPAALITVANTGDRIIGTDAASNVFISDDGGATWSAAQSVAGLLPAGVQIEQYGVMVAAGPLGYAATARAGSPNHEKYYLIHSADGVSWKVTDLASEGEPDKGWVSAVNVGADHVDVDYQVTVTRPNGVVGWELKTLVAIPKA
jgi:hypothetical protein